MKKIILSLLILVIYNTISLGQSTATYNVVFTNFWNSTDHSQGTSFPGSNAHWSNIVGVNHNDSVTFFEMGGTATTGVENIAELGVETVFEGTEVQAAIDANNAEQFFELGQMFLNAANTASLNGLEVSEDYPLISLLSMIAPSPDWFAGVSNLNLRDGGSWINTVTIDLFPYDAGTEDGTAYSLDNAASNPIGTIQSAQGVAPFNNEKVATLTFTLQSVLNTDDKGLKTFRLFPNPTNDKITIDNSLNVQLKDIEIYSAIGSLNQILPIKNSLSHIQIDVSNLNSGIYFLKLNTKENQSMIKKFIVK